jgi:hypothetical protein
LLQQPPRKKIMTRKTTPTIITHSIKAVLAPGGGHPIPDPQGVGEITEKFINQKRPSGVAIQVAATLRTTTA